MKKIRLFTVAAILLTLFAFNAAQAEDKFITLGWAAWDPANALVELSKDFTKQTGIKSKPELKSNLNLFPGRTLPTGC